MGWTHRQGNNKIFVAVHDVRSFWFLPEMFDVDVAYLSSPIIYRRKVNLESDPLTLINKTGAPFPRSSPSSIKTIWTSESGHENQILIICTKFVLKVSCSTAFVCRTLCLLPTHFAMHWAIFTGHCQMSGVYFLPWTYNLRSLRRLKSLRFAMMNKASNHISPWNWNCACLEGTVMMGKFRTCHIEIFTHLRDRWMQL